jgi:arabinose-5-phosphate isomerase
MKQKHDYIESAKRTIQIERDAVNNLLKNLDSNFETACELMLKCQGRIIVTGMGKSGHIGRKIAATLASTGTPAFFVHPGEASHGDLGMITSKDVVLAISNSGKTDEILTILPLIKRMGAPLISLTGSPTSILAQSAEAHLNASIEQEACPMGLAPTSSTTVSLVLGDAMAVALLEARGFSANDFAFSHPGGALGRRLLLKVSDIMHTGDDIPIVKQGTPLTDALLMMTKKKLGMTAVVNDSNQLIGIFTDGDLRRALESELHIRQAIIDEVMTTGCKTITPGLLAAEALAIMEDNKINALVVIDTDSRPVGALNMHDLLRAGVM